MMKHVISSIGAASLGLVIGLLSFLTTTSTTTPIERQEPVRTRADRSDDERHAGNDSRSPGKHTLHALFHLNLARVYRDDVTRQLQRAEDEQLERLLQDLIARDKPGSPLSVANLRRRVVREIYQRKGRSSLEWAEQIGHPEVFAEFILRFAYEDALAAAEWMDRFKAVSGRHLKTRIAADPGLHYGKEPVPEFDRSEYLQLVSGLSRAAMVQGADIALAFRKRMGDESDESYGSVSLPDDFDCRKYLEALNPEKIACGLLTSEMVGFWATHDKDAALAFVRNLPELPSDRYILVYEELFGCVCAMNGEKAAAGWLSDSLTQVSEDERNRLFSGLYLVQQPSPAAFGEVLEGLRDERDRVAFASSIIKPHESMEEVLSYLGLLEPQSLRMSTIEASSRTWAEKSANKSQAAYRRGFYESIMAKADVPPDTRNRILAMWQEREASLPN